jgi:hypothetical protein
MPPIPLYLKGRALMVVPVLLGMALIRMGIQFNRKEEESGTLLILIGTLLILSPILYYIFYAQ